jgi:uncharacterized cupredoxin-like copper-binding protein
MSTLLETPRKRRTSDIPPTVGEIDGLAQELRRQGKSIRATQQAFTIFAVMALILALATFLAVTIKLDKKTSPVVSAPVVSAPASSAPAVSAPATQSQSPAPASAAPAVGRSTRAVLKEYSIAPTPGKAAAGKVSFTVANAGKIEHEFVVLRTNKSAGDLLKGKEANEAGNVGEIGSVLPGQTKKLTLNLKAGHYALICNLPGHYTAGQHADFTVVNVK